jgi:hypothetical protein
MAVAMSGSTGTESLPESQSIRFLDSGLGNPGNGQHFAAIHPFRGPRRLCNCYPYNYLRSV